MIFLTDTVRPRPGETERAETHQAALVAIEPSGAFTIQAWEFSELYALDATAAVTSCRYDPAGRFLHTAWALPARGTQTLVSVRMPDAYYVEIGSLVYTSEVPLQCGGQQSAAVREARQRAARTVPPRAVESGDGASVAGAFLKKTPLGIRASIIACPSICVYKNGICVYRAGIGLDPLIVGTQCGVSDGGGTGGGGGAKRFNKQRIAPSERTLGRITYLDSFGDDSAERVLLVSTRNDSNLVFRIAVAQEGACPGDVPTPTPLPTQSTLDDCSLRGHATNCTLCRCSERGRAPLRATAPLCDASVEGGAFFVHADAVVFVGADGSRRTATLEDVEARVHRRVRRLAPACAAVVNGMRIVAVLRNENVASHGLRTGDWLLVTLDAASFAASNVVQMDAYGPDEFSDMLVMAYRPADASTMLGTTPAGTGSSRLLRRPGPVRNISYLVSVAPGAPPSVLRLDGEELFPGSLIDTAGLHVQSLVYNALVDAYYVLFPVFGAGDIGAGGDVNSTGVTTNLMLRVAADPAAAFTPTLGQLLATNGRGVHSSRLQTLCVAPGYAGVGGLDTDLSTEAFLVTLREGETPVIESWSLDELYAQDVRAEATACTFDAVGRFMHSAWVMPAAPQRRVLVTMRMPRELALDGFVIHGPTDVAQCGEAAASEAARSAEQPTSMRAHVRALPWPVECAERHGGGSDGHNGANDGGNRVGDVALHPERYDGLLAVLDASTCTREFVVTAPSSLRLFSLDVAQRGKCGRCGGGGGGGGGRRGDGGLMFVHVVVVTAAIVFLIIALLPRRGGRAVVPTAAWRFDQ